MNFQDFLLFSFHAVCGHHRLFCLKRRGGARNCAMAGVEHHIEHLRSFASQHVVYSITLSSNTSYKQRGISAVDANRGIMMSGEVKVTVAEQGDSRPEPGCSFQPSMSGWKEGLSSRTSAYRKIPKCVFLMGIVESHQHECEVRTRKPVNYIRALLFISYRARRTLTCTSEVEVLSHIRVNNVSISFEPLRGCAGWLYTHPQPKP